MAGCERCRRWGGTPRGRWRVTTWRASLRGPSTRRSSRLTDGLAQLQKTFNVCAGQEPSTSSTSPPRCGSSAAMADVTKASKWRRFSSIFTLLPSSGSCTWSVLSSGKTTSLPLWASWRTAAREASSSGQRSKRWAGFHFLKMTLFVSRRVCGDSPTIIWQWKFVDAAVARWAHLVST